MTPLLHSAPLARVLPVEVEAVKVVPPDEVEGAGREQFPLVRVPGHDAVVLAALVPAADGEGHLDRKGQKVLDISALNSPSDVDGST